MVLRSILLSVILYGRHNISISNLVLANDVLTEESFFGLRQGKVGENMFEGVDMQKIEIYIIFGIHKVGGISYHVMSPKITE